MRIGISRPHMDQDVEIALRLLPNRIQTAIDLGCGMGKLGKITKILFPSIKITGIDGNPNVIDALRQTNNNPYDEIRCALVQDFLSFPLKVDLIMMGDILEHLSNDEVNKIIRTIHLRCRFALIVGPEQTKTSLMQSLTLRNSLPALESHLSLLNGKQIANMLGPTKYFSKKQTQNDQGKNPYLKFCLLNECKSS